ncbi:MAG: phosphopentomutase [Clostridia bacterium]|nr:phosphopentomutase [Clostridia bacterium]
MKRVFLIVLDSFGIGKAPDAADFGDEGANTLKTISSSGSFCADNLIKLGLSDIDGVDCLPKTDSPIGSYGAMIEKSRGKDTTIGHWEIAGIISEKPMPTFPAGFDEEIIEKFEKAVGRKVICNKVYSGTQVIKDYGQRHLKTGELIVYTSADSVFQIAAHEDVVPVRELYDICKKAREILVGKYSVGRVIARPFAGEYPFYRTKNRHDFSLEPPEKTMLDELIDRGFDVISVGKIADIFAKRGITESHYTTDNADGMQTIGEITKRNFNGICFANLVDFDMLYGHRRDVDGYAKAIADFDKWLGEFLGELSEDDMMIITADHGCDPAYKGTDHTRERVPVLIYKKNGESRNLGTLETFGFVAKTVLDHFAKN